MVIELIVGSSVMYNVLLNLWRYSMEKDNMLFDKSWDTIIFPLINVESTHDFTSALKPLALTYSSYMHSLGTTQHFHIK